MKYVIGIDIGTSAVKILLVSESGELVCEESVHYAPLQERNGFVEQDPEDWVNSTIIGISRIIKNFRGAPSQIEGISFSGQMHGLVLLDKHYNVLRNAILWNDTRTTEECLEISKALKNTELQDIIKNPVLEGFTLPKILWVQEHEPEVFSQAHKFLLPKDYVRFRLTGELCTEYSDAAGTLLLDVVTKKWSEKICNAFNISQNLCPSLVASHAQTGTVTENIANQTGLKEKTKVFAGGADNACSAIGTGILENGKTLCSIGTSGVILSYEEKTFNSNITEGIHFFNHALENSYYKMGVTLAAGDSLNWFKEEFAKEESFEELLSGINASSPGSDGLLFTPYIVGERTPHNSAMIRGSFIGLSKSHTKQHFIQAIVEGITFSLRETIDILRENGKTIKSIVSTGGGSQSNTWLQMQADIFDAEIVKLSNVQGPGLGAAMLAAYGCGWFNSLQECADRFISVEKAFIPNPYNTKVYEQIYEIYKDIYHDTINLNEKLVSYRK
ncbi:Xylulokinase [Lentibacillus sp. JNUCC-1]|uniref:xylulokinase n=1 Tax=Lentibacillus sp. JNUCC-1 TaxID=2654513 RepID=UPI0012E98C29|nr:xylulokinase [Lentibacillus sp. JNUCC-1]MUV37054.1 Xylulokinase [Lentibacillus sp. JNUCC-1]